MKNTHSWLTYFHMFVLRSLLRLSYCWENFFFRLWKLKSWTQKDKKDITRNSIFERCLTYVRNMVSLHLQNRLLVITFLSLLFKHRSLSLSFSLSLSLILCLSQFFGYPRLIMHRVKNCKTNTAKAKKSKLKEKIKKK